MKVVIISDSHNNVSNLKHVMGFAKKIKAQFIIHCGDWTNIGSIETVLSYGICLYSILGNADINPEIGKFLNDTCKKFDRVFLKFELGKRKIGVIHNLKKFNFNNKVNILFFGHSHLQGEFSKGGLKIINPGALENGINFVIYDTFSDKIEFIKDE